MDGNKRTVRILVSVIAVLVLFIIFAFVVKPAINSYVVNKQVGAYNQGQTDLLNNLLVQMQGNDGVATIPVGNYTLVLNGQLLDNNQVSQGSGQ